MRALLGMMLFSMAGCETLWGGYVGNSDFGTACMAAAGCDMAMAEVPDAATPPDLAVNPPDLQPGDCVSVAECAGSPNPYCDLNMGRCVATQPPTNVAFITPAVDPNLTLDNRYLLMAVGDYNGDGVNDVAVSGVFPSVGGTMSINATGATANIPVVAYLSNKVGGLAKDTVAGNCTLPAGEAIVHLLTVAGAGKQDLLVAGFSGSIYRCSRGATSWTTTPVTVSGMAYPNTFKQLSIISDEGPSTDLLIRSSKVLFTDGSTGDLTLHRGGLNGNFNGTFNGATTIQISSNNVITAMPYRFAGDTYDTLATTWAGTVAHPGIEFHYVNQNNMFSMPSSVSTAMANVSDGGSMPYSELSSTPLSAMVPFKVLGQAAPSILYTYSQKKNSFTVLYGASPTTFLIQAQQKNLTPDGLMLPYAGDANGDGQDEIGLYTLAVNNTAISRHLQLLSYKAGVVGATAIVDLNMPTENFRGMALEYLGLSDKQRTAKRKDLITLLENPGGVSRLLVLRPDLNYVYQ